MARYVVKLGAVISPGTVANAHAGDTVRVHHDATERPDWGALVQALMTAYVKGAEMLFTGSNPRGDSTCPPAWTESNNVQVRGGAV